MIGLAIDGLALVGLAVIAGHRVARCACMGGKPQVAALLA